MNHKVHHSQGKVPFPWDKNPDVSNEVNNNSNTYPANSEYDQTKQLPLPPYRPEIVRGNDVQDNMSNKVHHLEGKVPFSWGKKPGASKEVLLKDSSDTYPTDSRYDQIKQLPLPPSRQEIVRGIYVHDLQLLPLPPCGFLPLQRSTSKKGLKKQDDPFFTAYRACTKSGKRGYEWTRGNKDDAGGFGISKSVSMFSCKASCSVSEGSMVMMISKNSTSSKSQREKGEM